jgi:hypothetical protein
MKQPLSLFLFLLPCLALAQYPSNGNQKITLGEQTSADGLVYRGVLADTGIITPSRDTSAYIILDTVNHRFYNYNRATNVWSMAGVGSISSGLTGVLPVANGGTNTSTAFTAGSVVFAGASGTYTQNNSGLFWDNTNSRLGVGTASPGFNLDVNGTGMFSGVITTNGEYRVNNASGDGILRMYSGGTERATIRANANKFFIEVGSFGERFAINSNGVFEYTGAATFTSGVTAATGTFSSVGAGAYANDLNITSTGVLTTASSDEKYKYNILPINYGLNTILQLNPVNFQWIKGEEKDLGFIAQDVAEIIPEAVDTNWNSDLLMRYESIIPILTKAIQEQQALIKALEQRIINLENK